MLAKILKNKLGNSDILIILEKLGCHHIKDRGKVIVCGLPDGDNPTSLNCYTNNDKNKYHCEINTRSDFEKYGNKDIITAVQYINKCSYSKAVKFICEVVGIDYYDNSTETSPCLSFLDFIETGIEHKHEEVKILPNSVLNQFCDIQSSIWLSEGISLEAQKHFEIYKDPVSERIIIPIRNEIGDLVGIKGRTVNDDTEESKYTYLYPCPKSHLLYGLYSNYEAIKSSDEVIVLEAEKGVMKAFSMGFPNAIAISGKSLSEIQTEQLIRLDTDITLCLDNDVTDDEINSIVKKITFPFFYKNIYIIKDDNNVLKEKDSPIDACLDEFLNMYWNKQKVY